MVAPHPLVNFSAYLAGRHEVLRGVAREIVALLDASLSDEGMPSLGARTRASDLMWLWTLGAYEVVRTMCQAADCFSRDYQKRLSELKCELERVRVPNTKMERVKYDRRAATLPVPSDREADRWVQESRDLLVGDPLDAVSARSLLQAYVTVLGAMRFEDVRLGHEASFSRPKPPA